MGREDDRVRQPRYAAARRRLRFAARDASWALRPRRTPPAVLFLLGAQRSGTSMLLDALGADHRVKVYDEYCSLNLPNPVGPPPAWWDPRNTRRYDDRMKPFPEVARRLARRHEPVVVSKPLVESHRAPALLDTVPGARAVWLVRRYADVAGSNVRKFGPELNETNLRPLAERDPHNWRSEVVADDVAELVAGELGPELSAVDGAALFWYARNRLYFDLGLDRDPRVLLVAYEDLVGDPATWLRLVYEHLGVPFDGAVDPDIHQHSVGRAREVVLRPAVAEACARLTVRFADVLRRRTTPGVAG